MISRTLPQWQKSLQEAVSSPEELLKLLDLPLKTLGASAEARQAVSDFPLRVPRRFVQLMERGNPRDPLLLQVLPRAQEAYAADGFSKDPLAEVEATSPIGILHKYRGRALVVLTGSCGIHCRYCFRRHFPYAERGWNQGEQRQTLEFLRCDPTLEEVILSGGD
ncbi:MAG: EF-P beta-lysylation protein EpmB, partial [Acidobacteria bacterium]|nr:EF-P beta-lysylation protein EpmB [Acidobacteriota bacterium]